MKIYSDLKRRLTENTPKYNRWRKGVYKRDSFSCQRCHVGYRLEAHHILNYSEHPLLRYDLENGITLCCVCHGLFHTHYGNVHNDREQVEEFICKKLLSPKKLF